MNNSHSSFDHQQRSITPSSKMSTKLNLLPLEHIEGKFFLCQKADGSPVIYRDEKKMLVNVTMGSSTLVLFKPAEVDEGTFQYLRSAYATVKPIKLPCQAVVKEDKEELITNFREGRVEIQLANLEQEDQEVIIKIVKIFPAKPKRYSVNYLFSL